jgi:hypothetical protein
MGMPLCKRVKTTEVSLAQANLFDLIDGHRETFLLDDLGNLGV